MTADDLIRSYGSQAWHAARRLAYTNQSLGEGAAAGQFEALAQELQRRGYDRSPDLGPSPSGGPAWTVAEQRSDLGTRQGSVSVIEVMRVPA